MRTPTCEGVMADTRAAPSPSPPHLPAPVPSIGPWTRVLWTPGTGDASKSRTAAIDTGGRAVVPLVRHFAVPRCELASVSAATPTPTGRFQVCFRFRPDADAAAGAHADTTSYGSADLDLEPGTARGAEAAGSYTDSRAKRRTDRPAPALVRFSFGAVRAGKDSGGESADARPAGG